MPNGHLEKIEISKRIFIVFCENEDTGLYWWGDFYQNKSRTFVAEKNKRE